MEISDDTVRHVAKLARVALTPEQTSAMRVQLDKILAHVEKLKELDTEDVTPFVHPSEETNRFRADKPFDGLERKDALVNAPDTDQHFFKVPKIIE